MIVNYNYSLYNYDIILFELTTQLHVHTVETTVQQNHSTVTLRPRQPTFTDLISKVIIQ